MRLLIGVLVYLACSGAALAQEVAGRVLFSIGDVAIVRGTSSLPAGAGAEVLSGDTIRVGEASNVQLRMSDESLIALQPRTTFQISDYEFAGKEPGNQRAFFRLAVGVMRTVTGVIGHINRNDYRVQTPTATIGIRGTHYLVAHLDKAQGELAAGTYGAVTDGRIAVTNQTGEHLFGADQHFYLQSPTQAPVGLPGPPPRFGHIAPPARAQAREERARTAATTVRATTGDARVTNSANGATVSAAPKQDPATSQSATTGGGTTSSDSSTVSAPVAAQPASLISISGPATLIGGTPIVQPSLTGTVFFRIEGPFNIVPTSCSNPPCNSFVNGNIFLGVNLQLQRAVVSLNLVNNNGEAFNISTPSPLGGIPITVGSNGQITFSQSLNSADFPFNQGAFRCQTCSATSGVGEFTTVSVNGTISGSTATLNLACTAPSGCGSLTVTLPQVTPTNFVSAGAILPDFNGGRINAGGSYWSVSTDSSGRLLAVGPGSSTSTGVGWGYGAAGTATTNAIAGSAPTAGNLVWGSWTGSGVNVTDFNYVSFTTGSGTFIPWITGTTPNTLPPSLGSFTYTPVGYLINNGTGLLNSASLAADFNARSLSLSINATNPGAANTFQMNATNSFSPINGRFGGGFASVTCNPCKSTGTPGGNYNGFFAGPNAEGAGVAFTAGFGTTGGVTGVVAFKR